MTDVKRLYFGFDIKAPWPEILPTGRHIEQNERHLTLAFLGNKNLSLLLESINDLPLPPFAIGPTGLFSKCLFLPPRHPHCVSWEVEWQEEWHTTINDYQEALCSWLVQHAFMEQPERDFHPHVTICRHPFVLHEWKKSFTPLPLFATGLHLFESLGHSTYRSHWHHPFLEPFTEVAHTADIAFLVRGATLQELFVNAETALAFTFPQLPRYFFKEISPQSIEEIVAHLNHLIAIADQEIGSPFKAVSYHGDLVELYPNIFEWEMIVDV